MLLTLGTDTALLVQHIRQLKDNKPICLPTYDFSTHCRTDKTTIVQPKRIVIVEGILIFCDQELVNEFDIKVFVVCALAYSLVLSCNGAFRMHHLMFDCPGALLVTAQREGAICIQF